MFHCCVTNYRAKKIAVKKIILEEKSVTFLLNVLVLDSLVDE